MSVEDEWRTARDRVVRSFDRVADLYRRDFADKLAGKPYDRAWLDRVAARVDRDRPVLEVGAGPAQAGAHLRGRGVPVLASDGAPGQLRQARLAHPGLPVLAADLARLPVRTGSLAGIVAYYCLMYGPAHLLDRVLADWRRTLAGGGLAAVALHAGSGSLGVREWDGRPVDITLLLRDPDDLRRRFAAAGFAVDELAVREPYPDEQPTRRCYLTARAG